MPREGRIVRSLSGFYDVISEGELYRCRARGIFRARGEKPLVGDLVEFEITDTVSDPMEGNVTLLRPRRNVLLRPPVCNLDLVLLVFAVTHPLPSYHMLDRLLLSVSMAGIPALLLFGKTDLAAEESIEELRRIYGGCGVPMIFFSAVRDEDLGAIRERIRGKTVALAGPSGVGKSTLLNRLVPGAIAETGELSRKIERGKNTTRHTELFYAGEETYLCDTPGFTFLNLDDLPPEDLALYYPEFAPMLGKCRFDGCLHDREPDCAVKAAVERGRIPSPRYENYRAILQELKERKTYR